MADDTEPEALADNTQNVGFLHDQQVFAADLDFGSRPLAEQNLVASLDFQSDQLASFVTSACANSDDFAFLRLFLGGVRDDDAASGLGFRFNATNDDAVMKRAELDISHGITLGVIDVEPC